MKRGFGFFPDSKKDKNRKFFHNDFFPKNRRGISVMIGYILLISMAIMMSIIVYQWVKTYVPQESIKCGEGTSLFIQGYSYDCATDSFDLTLKNNGRFDLAGYFIHVTTNPSQELAVTDISRYTTPRGGGGSVKYPSLGNDLNTISAGSSFSDSFDITSLSECSGSEKCIHSVEIIPLRKETINNKNRDVACTEARIQEPLICGIVGNPCIIDGDRKPWEDCDGDDLGGKITCEDAFGAGWIGTLRCTNSCTFMGCIAPVAEVCGDGAIQRPNDDGINEQCDDGNTNPSDGCSSSCQIEVLQIGQYYGFESGEQGWSDTGDDSDRSNARSKVLDNGQDGGSWGFHLQKNSISSITSQNFDFTNFKEMTIKWWGYYTSFENNDCLYFKVDNLNVNNWGESGCTSTITEDSWLSQEVTITNTQYTFDNSVELRFEGEMNSDNDDFYIDGINVSGKKY